MKNNLIKELFNPKLKPIHEQTPKNRFSNIFLKKFIIYLRMFFCKNSFIFFCILLASTLDLSAKSIPSPA